MQQQLFYLLSITIFKLQNKTETKTKKKAKRASIQVGILLAKLTTEKKAEIATCNFKEQHRATSLYRPLID